MYDIEDILDNTKTILQNDLNTQIGIINTDKSDSITLDTIDSSAYAYQVMDNEIFNYNPFIFFGVTGINNNTQGPYVLEEIIVSVMLIAADEGTGEDMTRKMIRYQTALKETIKTNWPNGGIKNKITIESLLPVQIEQLNDSQDFRVVGIEFKTTIS